MTTNSDGRGWLWLGAALFAIGYEVVMQVLSWWLLSPPKSFAPILSLKVTANLGLPSFQQLLEAAHLPRADEGYSLVIGLLTVLIYGAANAYYLSLLARSQHDLPGGPLDDLSHTYGKLLLWMIVQTLVGAVMIPLIVLVGEVGGLLSVAFLLWFRYHFLFFEFVLLVERSAFTKTFRRAVELRKRVQRRALSAFITIVVIQTLLAFFLNGFFSFGTIALLLPLQMILLTMIQSRLMQAFFEAREA
ncbi:hypothetical protein CIG75_18005 [Tumebacillus algifaecis]|uniref:Uncharacterized protein n=1 Tax=Tumebacillus algifaecis TaxID=1214604 RepID=A0A223D5B1_9BACL|nr:hypothetical protein [Tumebacillus algifaecis]ASS76677.1 hypothetical protein CIG75_18005 [Tumebacillus algifaecis]